MPLKKRLGLVHVFSIASGAMISSGLFVLPGIAFAQAGPAVVVSYLIAGLLATTGLLSTAELATAMPKAGSDYFFITRGLGPGVGTMAGLFNWLSFSLKAAFALIGMGAVLQLIVPVDFRLTATGLGIGFVILNLAGVKEAARVQMILVLGLLAIMTYYVIRGLPAVSVARFEPFAPHGWSALFSTAGLVFISYGGLLKIASVAEEVRDPGRTIPAALLLSLVVGGLFYALMVSVTVGVLDPATLSGSLTPIADGAGAFMGTAGTVVVGAAAAMAFLTTANAGILTGSRYLLAMSRDGILPPPFTLVSRRRHTPYVAILVTGALVIVPLFINLRILAKSASVGLILTNILANASVIVLRESRLQNYRPAFRSPGYPWVQLVGILGFAFVLLEMGEEAFLVSACLAAAGFGLYWFYGRARVEQESALLHLVARLTAKELVSGTLESELKEIIRERDEIVADRFDQVIEESLVLHLDEAATAEEFFGQAAETLAPRLGMGREELWQALIEREKTSSTVLAPGLAIPHIVVDGEGTFAILLARCREGMRFEETPSPVHAAFVLVGTRDERNFHLRALAAIAQIASDPAFIDRWLAARDEQALRDLVLLGKRRRS